MAIKIQTLLYGLGAFHLLHSLWPSRLTILRYHRIGGEKRRTGESFGEAISATLPRLDKQMAFVARHFNVIDPERFDAWIQGRYTLPAKPALITFDGGFRETFEHVLPILEKHKLPALVFVAADLIDNRRPFIGDVITYLFHHTCLYEGALPLLGQRAWREVAGRTHICREWLNRAIALTDTDRWDATMELAGALEMEVPERLHANAYLEWDQVRQMTRRGVRIGIHARSLVDLAELPEASARKEIEEAKLRTEQETGCDVTAFAHFGGSAAAEPVPLQRLIREAGLQTAFSLRQGPGRQSETLEAPFAIRRICVHRRDALSRFALRLAGLARMESAPPSTW